MAEKYEIELEFNIETNIENVTNNTVIFTQATKNAGDTLEDTEKKAKNFGETVVDWGNKALESEEVMGVLNDVTDGFAGKVKNAVEILKIFTTQQKVASAVQALYTTVVGTSTGILKLFRLALASTGIGAIALVLGVLISNFDKIKVKIMSLLGPLQFIGDFFGDITGAITDFIGITSKASRELEKMSEEAQKGLKRDEMMMEINGDKYDELTKRKMQADLDYRKRLKEIQDMAAEDMTEEEKVKAAEEALQRKLRDEENAEKDSKANLLKILDNYHKRQEDANAKTTMEKIALEEKRALAELDLEKATEAQKNEIRNFYNGQREAENKKIADEAKKKKDEDIKAAIAKEKERNESIKNILKDYAKREIDALADTNIKKINLEEDRANAELKRLRATSDQKLQITKYYNNLRKQEEDRLAEETKKIQQEKDQALRALAFDQRKWEIDHMVDPLEKLKAQRKLLDDQAKLEIDALQKEITAAKEGSKEKADAEIRQATVKQNLQQAESENDEQQKKILADKAATVSDQAKKQKAIDEETDPRKKFEKQMQLYEEQRAAMQDQANFEMQNLRAVADDASLSAEKRADAEAQYATVKHNLEQSLADQDNKIADAKKQNDESVKQNAINTATSTVKMLADMGGKGAELAKGMAAAQAIQDTYKGATSAYSSMAGIPVVGPALGVAAAGVAVASGLMNVKKILATKPVEKSAPGGSAGGGAAPPAAPAFNLVQGTGTNQIAEAIGGQNTPIQAYVVSSNVTSAQSLDRNIVEQSTL